MEDDDEDVAEAVIEEDGVSAPVLVVEDVDDAVAAAVGVAAPVLVVEGVTEAVCVNEGVAAADGVPLLDTDGVKVPLAVVDCVGATEGVAVPLRVREAEAVLDCVRD